MNSSQDAAVEIINMNKYYGAFHALKDINLTIRKGEKVVVCGPSGSSTISMKSAAKRAWSFSISTCFRT